LRVSIERSDDDPPERLELDLVVALLEALSELLCRSLLDLTEVIRHDGVGDGVLLAHSDERVGCSRWKGGKARRKGGKRELARLFSETRWGGRLVEVESRRVRVRCRCRWWLRPNERDGARKVMVKRDPSKAISFQTVVPKLLSTASLPSRRLRYPLLPAPPHLNANQIDTPTMATSQAPIVVEDDEIEPAGENQVINEVRWQAIWPRFMCLYDRWGV
jgi:hypothetical protein